MIPESRLKTEDTHPVLKSLAEKYSGELNLDYIFRKENKDMVALNLVSVNTGEKKIVGTVPKSATLAKHHRLVTSIISEVITEDVIRYDVEFGYAGPGERKIHTTLLSAELPGVENQRQGISDLEKIAHDIKRIYELPYNPHIYKDQRFWK